MKEKIHLTRASVRQVTVEELPYVRGGVTSDGPTKKKAAKKRTV